MKDIEDLLAKGLFAAAKNSYDADWDYLPFEVKKIWRDVAQIFIDEIVRLNTPPKKIHIACNYKTDWRGCNRPYGHTGAHHDQDSGIDWTGGAPFE